MRGNNEKLSGNSCASETLIISFHLPNFDDLSGFSLNYFRFVKILIFKDFFKK